MENQVILSNKEEEQLIKWLNLFNECKKHECAFDVEEDDVKKIICAKICGNVFPEMDVKSRCPCLDYPIEYVVSKAKQLLIDNIERDEWIEKV